MPSLKRVMVTMPYVTWPLARQTPGESCRWGQCEFFINTPLSSCDAWIILEDLMGPQTTRCPAENVLLVAMEHHEIRNYPSVFTDQFSSVLTCHQSIAHPRKQIGQLGFIWHAGVCRSNNFAALTYDDFKKMSYPTKPKLLATVCSDKRMTPGHKSRLDFVNALRKRLATQVDVFGKTFASLDDKWDAIHPYTYQLVIENGQVNDWWTEKLADAYLGYSFPIYWGCPNLEKYFPEESFIRLDVTDMEDGLDKVDSIIHSGMTKVRVDAMNEARRRVLDQYNIFAMLDELVTKMGSGPTKRMTLRNEASFIKHKNISLPRRLRGLVGKICG